MPRRAALAVILVNAAFLACLAAWAAAGWPGKPNHILAEEAFYCEALRPGWIRQPVNTWSCLGFVAVGLILAGRARSRRGALLALLISLIGPASMALHASMTAFGGVIDVSSMFLFIGFAAALNAARLSPWFDKNFGVLCGAAGVVMVALAAWGSAFGPILFALLITVFLLGEVLVAAKGLGPARDRRRLAAAAGLFAAGMFVWFPSVRTDGPLCVPDSPLQGHAAWHLLCALAAGAIYLYLEPELV
jgi:hypothetical protein